MIQVVGIWVVPRFGGAEKAKPFGGVLGRTGIKNLGVSWRSHRNLFDFFETIEYH